MSWLDRANAVCGIVNPEGDALLRSLARKADEMEEALAHIVAVGLDTDDDFSDQQARAEMCAAAESVLGIGDKDWQERATIVAKITDQHLGEQK